MIIAQAPFRISFFGGGSDYPVWFRQNGGQVLSTSIDKYCYITARYLPPFFDYTHRIVWSKIETVAQAADIEHPVVNAIIQHLGIRRGVEIHHIGDLPARTGLGSSSSFTVALLKALHGLQGRMRTKEELAYEAIYTEQTLLQEVVGVQDQIAVAFGGFNHVTIRPDGSFSVNPVIISDDRLECLQNSLMLFYSGVSRYAAKIAAEKIKAIPGKQAEISKLTELVGAGIRILSEGDMNDFGRLLHEGWNIKRSISSVISTDAIDAMYGKARQAGALGGKVLGAGGGGFVVLFVEPDKQEAVRGALSDYLEIPFQFEFEGARISFSNKA